MTKSRQVNKTYVRLRRMTSLGLARMNERDQRAFDEWLAQHKTSQQSQQQDLPSSQMMKSSDLISSTYEQLFVVIDTCSIVKYRTELMQYVSRLKQVFERNKSPIRLIICLTVLEELDKCNRKVKNKQAKLEEPMKQPELEPEMDIDRVCDSDNLNDLIKMARATSNLSTKQLESNTSAQPPRSFMRFIEEEMRTGAIVISELDPFKQLALSAKHRAFEIVNKDDRILECCLRSHEYIKSKDAHEETKVILVTEDNVFKSKATTFGVVSYRWLEFYAKYKNFGLSHYVATPIASLQNLPTQANIEALERRVQSRRRLTQQILAKESLFATPPSKHISANRSAWSSSSSPSDLSTRSLDTSSGTPVRSSTMRPTQFRLFGGIQKRSPQSSLFGNRHMNEAASKRLANIRAALKGANSSEDSVMFIEEVITIK